MKKFKSLLTLGAMASMAVLLSACAHFSKNAGTVHRNVERGVILPPGWTAVVPANQLNLPADETNGYQDFAYTGTTAPVGFFSPRPRTFIAKDETWTDRSKGGGTFLFTDPQASQVSSSVNNQVALGGNHNFAVGSVSSVITTNAVNAITAVGNVIGAAANAAAK